MVRYGIPAHESVPNTLVILQKKFDDEFSMHMTAYTKFMERYNRKKSQADLESKMARDDADDADAFAHNPKIQILIVANNTHDTLMVRGLNDASARAVLRVLGLNQSVVSLDLSNNGLGESVVTDVARMLRTNKRVASVDLSSNRLNAKCMHELAAALTDNTVLTSLSLEGNPITTHGNTSDLSGFEALCGYISSTTTLESLNLFRTGLNIEAGRILAKSLLFNESVYFLELGCNALADKELEVIAVQMGENRQLHDDMASKLFGKRQMIQAEAKARAADHALERLKIETQEWHAANAVERRVQHEIDRVADKKRQDAEDARLRKIAADRDMERRLAMEDARLKAEAKAKKKKK
ncbi:hypothetical protein DYB37_006406 [Aphanomyces astaci]|uniref:Uncharacterized protein n=1 Tax=Aphanomyces astaci TaxID=112090 RepID=A0A397E0Q6_APHAT|nr:hypothetical protein DYB30_008924 [Aphanomyces astaci]RHY87706.1 hypothetical protein DYB35_007924 [Aphanomyces astaci]RHZ26652.1 hypothetical protein DYB37_006406 [Aphanomyces astaci]RQM24918.1 hypothetical protein B5M09_002470 [Aphanomyces astaci]